LYNKSSWQNCLLLLKNEAFVDRKPIDTEVVTLVMQKIFPGEYVVEEYFDNTAMTFDLRLKFNTPEDETVFYLKYA